MITQTDWNVELASRRIQVWQILDAHECEAGIIFGSMGQAEPFRYLMNFEPVRGDSWAILTGAQDITCVLNFDWQLDEARAKSGIKTWHAALNPAPVLGDILAPIAPARIGIAGLHRIPMPQYEVLRTMLPDTIIVDVGNEVAKLRWYKSPFEIALLQEAARLTDLALDGIRQDLRPGVTEYEIAAKLSYIMQHAGSEPPPKVTVISDNDHPTVVRMPTHRQLQIGDAIMIDTGASYHGYLGDASRTYVLGKANDLQKRAWSVILEAYKAALEQLKPGIPCNATHQAAQRIIETAGYTLPHRVGHGIGLATSFEYPSLISETSPFVTGMSICIEPGVCLPGAGTLKLEDDFVITEDGYQKLTHAKTDLVIPL